MKTIVHTQERGVIREGKMGKKEKEDKKSKAAESKGKKSKQEEDPARAGGSDDSLNERSGRRDDDRRQGGARDRNRDRSGRDRDNDREHDRDSDRDGDQDDDRKDHRPCPAVVSPRSRSQSQVTPCSNEQFLSSILPLLSSLKSKQNFLARIQIQKALYDAIDDMEDADSDDQCCPPPVKKKSASNCQAPASKGSQQRRAS